MPLDPNPRGLYPTFKTRKPEIFSGYPKYRNFDQKSGHFCLKNLKIFPLKIFPKKDEVFHQMKFFFHIIFFKIINFLKFEKYSCIKMQ